MNIVASSSITSWQIDRGKLETLTDFIFLCSKITEDSDCSHKIKRPWKKSYDKPRKHIKSRDITFLTWVHLVKAMVFPVGIYGCERKLSTEELMLLNCGFGEDS